MEARTLLVQVYYIQALDVAYAEFPRLLEVGSYAYFPMQGEDVVMAKVFQFLAALTVLASGAVVFSANPIEAQLHNPCPYTNDGDCDEPNGLGYCAFGTDVMDCSNPNSNFGNGSGFAGDQTTTRCFHTDVWGYNSAGRTGTHGPGDNQRYIDAGDFTSCRTGAPYLVRMWASECARYFSRFASSVLTDSSGCN